MKDTFRCGDQEALAAYLYDECDPGDREAIAAHLARCAGCAEEVAGLRATRRMLAAWTPPAASLGFQIGGSEARQEAVVLRPASWWRQPLPAWAQAAAAVLIFAAGILVGVDRSGAGMASLASGPPEAAPGALRADTAPAEPVVAREDLARLEQRVRAIESAQARNAAAPATRLAAGDDGAMRSVQALVNERISQSEERQRRETIRLIANVADELDAQQRDLERRMVGVANASRLQISELKEQQDTFTSMLPRATFVSTTTPRR